MADTPMPETLETIGQKLTALSKSIDERFAKVDQRFAKVDQQFAKVDQQFAKVDQQFAKVDQQFAETKSQLGVKIEAVDAHVKLVYDEVIALRDKAMANDKEHAAFRERLDKHELRILALEAPKALAPPQTP